MSVLDFVGFGWGLGVLCSHGWIITIASLRIAATRPQLSSDFLCVSLTSSTQVIYSHIIYNTEQDVCGVKYCAQSCALVLWPVLRTGYESIMKHIPWFVIFLVILPNPVCCCDVRNAAIAPTRNSVQMSRRLEVSVITMEKVLQYIEVHLNYYICEYPFLHTVYFTFPVSFFYTQCNVMF